MGTQSKQVEFIGILSKHNCLHLHVSLLMAACMVSLCCVNDVTLDVAHLDENQSITYCIWQILFHQPETLSSHSETSKDLYYKASNV